MTVEARGRDLVTHADGSAHVGDEVALHVSLDAIGTVLSMTADPAQPALAELVGDSVSRGFRARADAALPDDRSGATVVHQLLDDLPMANLISGYGTSRESPEFKLPADAAGRLTDLCAGWIAGGTMLHTLGTTGIFPIPVGPPAPELALPGDELSWHELPELARRSVRRRRRIDVCPGDEPGAPLEVDVHFRDSYLGPDGPEDVLHEYTLEATVDPASLTVLSSTARVRVLPWPECPNAVGSATRIVGHTVGELRALVSAEFTGTSTCTHLNDVLRSLAGVTALAGALTRA